MERNAGTEEAEGTPSYVDAWTDASSAFDRVMGVALALDRPRTAGWIADEAHVAEETARGHLRRLVDLRALASTTARGTTTYYPDSAYLLFRQVAELVEGHDRDELLDAAADVKEALEAFREEYGVDTPDDLRARAAAPETSASEAREYKKVASEWETVEHRRSVIQRAIEEYDRFGLPGPDNVPA